MKLPKYASAPLCMILCALAASSFAADKAPAAVPAAEQADYAEKMDEAAKAEAKAAAAADKAKKEAEAQAKAEKTRDEAEVARIKAEIALKEAEMDLNAAEAKAAADKAKAEAEAQAAADKAAADKAMKDAAANLAAARKDADAKAAAEAAKAEAEARAAADKAKAEAEARAAADKEKADKAKAEAEAKKEALAKAAADKAAADKAMKDAEANLAEAKAAAEKAAADKAKAEAEAKAVAEKAKAEAEAKAAADKAVAAEKAKEDAEAKAANAFNERFPELAKAIADANLSADKKAEIDVMSANLIASEEALDEISARDTIEGPSAERLEAEIEFLTQYTAILAAVPSPENETHLADRMLELQTAREERLFLAQKEFEEGKIDSAQLREIQDKYLKLDTPAEIETVKKEKKEPFWGYKMHKPLPVLLIVANYRIPRKVIAEYLRTEYDVPYILLPSDPGKPSKDDQVYFSGGKKNSGEHEVALPAVELSRFIAYLRPETVIILGDDSYINPVYRLAVPDSIRKVEFASDEWKVNTVRLDEFFRKTLKTNVSEHYLEYLQNQGKNKAE